MIGSSLDMFDSSERHSQTFAKEMDIPLRLIPKGDTLLSFVKTGKKLQQQQKEKKNPQQQKTKQNKTKKKKQQQTNKQTINPPPPPPPETGRPNCLIQGRYLN